MDHSSFFADRVRYIRFFYVTAIQSFREQKSAIENSEAPFDNPPYDESGEPAFLIEWLDADASEDVLGRACISMLSDALKIYLNDTRRDDLRFEFADSKALAGEFLRPHIEAFCQVLEIDVKKCPVSIDLLEQIVLARNRIQHGSILTSLTIRHDENTLERFPSPLFRDPEDVEKDVYLGRAFFSTKLTVTQDNLFQALDECTKLARWLGPVTWGPSWSDQM